MKVTIALPVLNEEAVLRDSVERLVRACRGSLAGHDVSVVIADNGSDDRTGDIARALASAHPEVKYLRLGERGKGRAVFAAWSEHPADVCAFMDIDLSTDLAALPALIAAAHETDGIAYGSRNHPMSVVFKSFGRRVYSLGYRLLLRAAFGTRITDAPCGFKAASWRVVRDIVPQVQDRRWFFDTELLIRAERAGCALTEIPVVWNEQTAPDRKSRVNAPKLAAEYLAHVIRLRGELENKKV